MLATERKRGDETLNYTSYLASQKEWAKDRDNRPSVLYQYQADSDYHEKAKENKAPLLFTTTLSPEYGEKLLIVDDLQEILLRHFSAPPLVVSSQVEGWLLEAWFRLEPALLLEDVIQRITVVDADPTDKKDWKRFTNRLVARRVTARDIGRMFSWAHNAKPVTRFDGKLVEDMEKDPRSLAENTPRYIPDLTWGQYQALKTGKKLDQDDDENGKVPDIPASPPRSPPASNASSAPTPVPALPVLPDSTDLSMMDMDWEDPSDEWIEEMLRDHQLLEEGHEF